MILFIENIHSQQSQLKLLFYNLKVSKNYMPKSLAKKRSRIIISDDEDEQISRGPSRIDSSSDGAEQQATSPKVVFLFCEKSWKIDQKFLFRSKNAESVGDLMIRFWHWTMTMIRMKLISMRIEVKGASLKLDWLRDESDHQRRKNCFDIRFLLAF